ncbi:MAG: hypothetical protein KDC43_29430 [Saprospiraceae bacterium]|nr:hypothetical protein [Saprospiraceae bacterium]
MLQFYSGMISEYKAAQFFTEIGWRVYWCFESQSKDDFIINKGNIFKKVQVKTATWSRSGKYKYLQCRVSNRNRYPNPKYVVEDFDLIVFIDGDNIWIADITEILGMNSVALMSTNPKPKTSIKRYNPDNWKIER